ncbi:MAG: hypothetical protein GX153_02445 [Clostridiaceae bacterium]|nr:hypothetical protein [Clostridiaceae bacterium]
MDKYLFSIGLIVAGLVVGQGIRRLAQTGRFRYPDRVGRLLRLLQQVALLGLSPLVTLGAF